MDRLQLLLQVSPLRLQLSIYERVVREALLVVLVQDVRSIRPLLGPLDLNEHLDHLGSLLLFALHIVF